MLYEFRVRRRMGNCRWVFTAACAVSMAASLFGGASAIGAVRRVPSDYPTIQSAINAAVNGDVVAVGPGTYPERLDLLGKHITVQSEQGPEATRIDGSGIIGIIVWCRHYESRDTVLRGFTIGRNLTGTGSGLYVFDGSNPTIEDCYFIGNSEDRGAAITVDRNSSPLIRRCRFEGNVAEQYGGAIYCSNGGYPMLVECTFLNNSAGLDGGALYLWYLTRPTVMSCSFFGNHANEGGAVFAKSGAEAMMVNCVFSGNTAGFEGAALDNGDATARFRNCTITANSAANSGSVIRTYSSGLTILDNTILFGNSAQLFHMFDLGSTVVRHSDIEGGWPGEGNVDVVPSFRRLAAEGVDGWGDDLSTPTIDEGANDDFGDLRLREDSPCIDAADNAALPADSADVDGDGDVVESVPWDIGSGARRLDAPLTADTGIGPPPVVDMGAWEFRLDGDLDGDWEVALDDYVPYVACLAGPASRTSSGCGQADLDGDWDVDLRDFADFQRALSAR